MYIANNMSQYYGVTSHTIADCQEIPDVTSSHSYFLPHIVAQNEKRYLLKL